jgi:VanZ family protein
MTDQKTLWKLIFGLYTACMLMTSLIPMDLGHKNPTFWSRLDPSFQNLLHIPMFMGFAYLLYRVLENTSLKKTGKTSVVMIISVFMSILLEGLQIFIPGRFPGWSDMALNLLGTALGIMFLLKTRIYSATPPNGPRNI